MTTNKTITICLLASLFLAAVSAGSPYLSTKEQHRINTDQSDWQAEIPEVFSNSSADQLKQLVSVFPPSAQNNPGVTPPDEDDDNNSSRLLQTIPTSFDARTKWPSCIGPIRYQGTCGACWAIASAEVFEDRLCIAGKVSPLVQRSAQYMLDCDTAQSGCNGGNPNQAWDFLKTYGTPVESCYPYTGSKGTCQSKCKNGAALTTRKLASVRSYNSINAAKQDIMTSGPIETWFAVYNDLYYYKSGIYSPTTSSLSGYHAVKIVGWGTDSKSGDYWIIANSWGASWGEKGFFRIKAGSSQIDKLSHFLGGTV